jgi:glycosyl transferase family 2
VIRRHWPFITILVLGTALRVLAMIAYRPAIFFIDSVASYLQPLPTLDPTGQDPIGYDLYLLGPVLRIGNLNAVVAIQHLLGLGMAVAGYVFLRHLGAWRWLATLATAPILLDAYQVQIEHNIMSDLLFEALLVAALVALAWSKRLRWPVVTGAALVLGLAVTVRQVGELLVLPLLAYGLLAGGSWRRRIAKTCAAALCFALPVAAYATYYHSFTGRYAISHAAGGSLYGRIGTFADCRGLTVPPEERVLCPTMPREERLGADFWAHFPESPLFQLRPPPGRTADDLALDFSLRVIGHQPLDFVGSVTGDAVKVFWWQRADLSSADTSVERWRFQVDPPFSALVSVEQITELSRQYGSGDPVVLTPLARVLRWYQLTIGCTPGPVLALSILLVLAGARRPGRARLPALLFMTSGVLMMLAGDVVIFSWRYQLPGYVLLPMAGALGAVALFRRRASPPFPEPADVAAMATIDPDVRLPPVVVLIAAFNEEAGLGAVLDGVPETCCGHRVGSLVVVDGATDGTAEVARTHGALTCVIPVNRGQGAALRLGYHVAAAHGARYIVTIDGDGQYDLTELARLLTPLLTGAADFVTGSRRLGADESTDPVRRLGTRLFAALVSMLTGQRVTDTSFGFRAMRAEVPASVTLNQPQYQSAELLISVLRQGYRVVEIPMTMHRRGHGRSKKGNNLAYGVRYARVVLGTWWRERKTTRSSTANLIRNSAA